MTTPLYELGETGIEISGGRIRQSRLRNFRGINRATVIREMAETDGTVKGILSNFILLAQAVDLTVSGPTENQDFVWECLDDMEQTRTNLIGGIMTMLPHGFSAHEKVFKQRLGRDPGMAVIEVGDKDVEVEQPSSKYDDGRIGWRDWPIRAQDTIDKWDLDEHGRAHGLWQRLKSRKTGGRTVYIPNEKLAHFRTTSPTNSPEGQSILEACYRAWFFKRHFEDQMGVAVKRDLTGFPVMSFPDEDDIWSDERLAERQAAEKLVASIFNDEFSGLVKPEGVGLDLMRSPGQKVINVFDVFKYLRLEMALATLTDFMMVGHEGAGSWALRKDARSPFMIAIQGYLGQVEDEINRDAIPQLLDLNGMTSKDEPTEVHFGTVDVATVEEVVKNLKDMAAVGFDVGGDEIRNKLLSDMRQPIPENETADIEDDDLDQEDEE